MLMQLNVACSLVWSPWMSLIDALSHCLLVLPSETDLPNSIMYWAFGQIVEFLAVLLKANSEGARQQLVSLGAIASVVNLFFEYVPHLSFWIYCTVS